MTDSPMKHKSGMTLTQTADMTYIVVIEQDGDTARLECATLEEAEQVKRSFINYGKCQSVSIEGVDNVDCHRLQEGPKD